jgi:hypothetical protein
MTPGAALQRQVELYREMTGEQRLKIALDLYEFACEIPCVDSAAIPRRHAGRSRATPAQAHRAERGRKSTSLRLRASFVGVR